MPRKSEAPTHRDFSLVCQVNDHRAPVRWYKGDQELPENKFERFLVTKDFVGNCKLTVIDPTKEDSGPYKCVIDNTKSVTKGTVKFEGSKRENHYRSCPLSLTRRTDRESVVWFVPVWFALMIHVPSSSLKAYKQKNPNQS